MLARRLLALLVAGSVGLLAACQESRAPAPAAASAPADPLPRAREAVKRGDHAAAIVLLRDAIAARADGLEAHYLLAVSASHLDQADEAAREFQWVAEHGRPDSAEAAIARQWLAARIATPVEPPASAPVAPTKPELASVSGVAADASGPKARLLLFLKGAAGGPAAEEYRSLRTDRQGRFRFVDVLPGDYVLTNAVAGPARWRLRLSLARGEQRTLDLSAANASDAGGDATEARR